ncbi:MAG: EAL domain-containing protein [Xanthomonadaceae bacterium]|nr:EAL domain-containing protein [Xanthomonadaceae bacterium]
MDQAHDISIAWSKELHTGDDVIDSQHQRLIELFNRLAAVRAQEIDAEVVAPLLDELRDYTGYHFRHEAEQMRIWRVDEGHQRVHLAAHQSFVAFLRRTSAMLDDCLADGLDDLVLFLSQWLLNHIMGMDVKMTREIRQRQAGVAATGAAAQEHAVRDRMTHLISALYNNLGERTFELNTLNGQLTREINDRKRSEEALRKVDRLLRALIQAGDLLLTAYDEPSAMQIMCKQLMNADLFLGCCILEATTSRQTSLRAFTGPAEVAESCRALAEGFAEYHPIEQAWEQGSTLCVNEEGWLDQPSPWVEGFTRAGLRSWVAIPLDHESIPSCMLLVASTQPECFDTKVILLMLQAASLLKRACAQIELKRTLADERQRQGHLARHDLLTGLPNRLGLLEHLPIAMDRNRRHGTALALGVIDLDDFKPVNDTWGHAAGDRLLKELARRLQSLLRGPDLIARLGGDEFVVVLEDLDERAAPQQLNQVLQRLHQAVETPFELASGVLTGIGMSMGLAIFPQHGIEADGLMRQADLALYRSKASKLDRSSWWTQEASSLFVPQEIAPLSVLDPYGLVAVNILQKACETVELVTNQFIAALYETLAETPEARRVLASLSPAELQALHIRQAEHLRFLLDPSSTQELILQRASQLGRVHALVNVKSSLLIQTSTLYRTLLVNQLGKTTLRASERNQLQWLINARMEDDIKAQLLAHEAVQESYLACLAAEFPAVSSRWMDTIDMEMDVLNRLPGVKAVVLMRLDRSGAFVVEAFAGSIGKQVAQILSDPETSALVDASVPRGQGLTAQSWRSGKIHISASYQNDPRYAAWHELVAYLGIRSTMALPIMDPLGHPVAVLGFYGAYPNQFSSSWMLPFAHGIQRRWSRAWQACNEAPSLVLTPDVAQSYRTRLFDDGLALYMQPIVDLGTGKVVKVEALARLQLDGNRLIYPDAFIPLLGDVELARLFQLCLEKLLTHLTRWHRQGLVIGGSVNLHPSTFQNPETAALVAEALSRHGIAPQHLSLELLEFGGLEGPAQHEAFERISETGVSIEMDDLGSGFSSLQRLSALPFASTKIDRSLVSSMRKDPLKTFSMLAALIALSQDMHRPVVLEGLEEPSMIEVASVLGAAYGQGYALARPMAAEAIPAWAGSFSLSAAPRPIHTFLGALACLWWTNRSFQGQWPKAKADCPLARFLEAQGPAAIEALAWYGQMRDDADGADGGARLQAWLLRKALGEG